MVKMFLSISLNGAGNMVGSKKKVIPNFMLLWWGGGWEVGVGREGWLRFPKPGRNTSLLAKDPQVCQSQLRHIFQEVLY